MKNICQKTNQKRNATVRIANFTSPFQEKLGRILSLNLKVNTALYFGCFHLKDKIKRSTNSWKISQISFKWPPNYIGWNAGAIKWKGNSLMLWMTFSICERILASSKTCKPLLLMFLAIINCLPLLFTGQISYGKVGLLTRKSHVHYN